MYRIIWHGRRCWRRVSMVIPAEQPLPWTWSCAGWHASPILSGQAGWYFLLGHNDAGRVWPRRSFSKSTMLPLICDTAVPPTMPNSIRHWLQFSYLIGLRVYERGPVLWSSSFLYAHVSYIKRLELIVAEKECETREREVCKKK